LATTAGEQREVGMESVWSVSNEDLIEILTRLILACVLAALIGLDRELRNKPVGLRTMMLVSLGAAAFSIVVVEMVLTMGDGGRGRGLAMDPTRVVEGIVGGIGFLGAGAIIQGRDRVRGVTTGASIWVVGAIGMACGFGFYVHAAIVTGIAMLVLTVLGALEHWMLGPKEETPPG
jgi:putative Mg2+ transporter-C (MgtC) family protein